MNNCPNGPTLFPRTAWPDYCDEGKQALISDENLSVTQGPWSKIQPLTVFKGQELEDCFRDLEVRLMWDKDNVYIAYKIPNEKIGTQEDPYTNISPLLSDGSWWQGATPEFMETSSCWKHDQYE